MIDPLATLDNYLKDTKVYGIFLAEKERLALTPGGERHHHNFKGGLIQHMLEMLKFGLPIAEGLKNNDGENVISREEFIVSVFLHDLAKMEFYTPDDNGITYSYIKHPFAVQEMLVQNYCAKYGVVLTENEMNALWMAEGGWSVLNGKLENSPLATLLHMSDLFSAMLLKPQLKAVTSCPTCGKGELVKRTNNGSRNVFWACNRYPECKYTQGEMPAMMLSENYLEE